MNDIILVSEHSLEGRTFAALRDAGADERSARAATRAMMHASRLGIDSHGVRLTPHYARVLRSGRVNPHPKLESRRTAAASAVVDADNGLGHPAAYAGMELAGELAKETGIAPGLFNAHWTPLYERLTVGSMAAIQRARAMFSAPLARAMLST